jgi:hypothetical protein
MKMTNVGQNMWCEYTSDVEDMLKFKTFRKQVAGRWLITNKE